MLFLFALWIIHAADRAIYRIDDISDARDGLSIDQYIVLHLVAHCRSEEILRDWRIVVHSGVDRLNLAGRQGWSRVPCRIHQFLHLNFVNIFIIDLIKTPHF